MATSLTIQILTDVTGAVKGVDQVEGKTSSFGSESRRRWPGRSAGRSRSRRSRDGPRGGFRPGSAASRAMKDVKVPRSASAAEAVGAWGEKAAAARSARRRAEAEKAAAKVGVALEGYGLSQTEAAMASEVLVQRSAEIAKVMGVDQTPRLLAKVETAMRGRTAGLKDYGVQVEKGASATQILNGFIDQTAQFSGQATTPLATFHATFGNMSEQLGQALIPAVSALIPLIQAVADWATNNQRRIRCDRARAHGNRGGVRSGGDGGRNLCGRHVVRTLADPARGGRRGRAHGRGDPRDQVLGRPRAMVSRCGERGARGDRQARPVDPAIRADRRGDPHDREFRESVECRKNGHRCRKNGDRCRARCGEQGW